MFFSRSWGKTKPAAGQLGNLLTDKSAIAFAVDHVGVEAVASAGHDRGKLLDAAHTGDSGLHLPVGAVAGVPMKQQNHRNPGQLAILGNKDLKDFVAVEYGGEKLTVERGNLGHEDALPESVLIPL